MRNHIKIMVATLICICIAVADMEVEEHIFQSGNQPVFLEGIIPILMFFIPIIYTLFITKEIKTKIGYSLLVAGVFILSQFAWVIFTIIVFGRPLIVPD